MTRTAAIVDYGMGNVASVALAVEECGGTPLLAGSPEQLAHASHIILPGVGAFPDAMRSLRERHLDAALAELVLRRGIPFLGICLGMQLLATCGWEGEKTKGLGWIAGEACRLEAKGADTRIPHIGWNEVILDHVSPLFHEIPSGKDFYFVHSYQLCPADPGQVLAHTPYSAGFVSAVECGPIFGVQFHPEKSQRWGLRLLRNFLSL